MSQFDRKMDILNRHRLIYIRPPVTDKPTEVFDWGSYYEMAHINTMRCLEVKLR